MEFMKVNMDGQAELSNLLEESTTNTMSMLVVEHKDGFVGIVNVDCDDGVAIAVVVVVVWVGVVLVIVELVAVVVVGAVVDVLDDAVDVNVVVNGVVVVTAAIVPPTHANATTWSILLGRSLYP
jgi:hypothetical protein